MDRVNTPTSPADGVHCAIELSKNSWLLGIQFPYPKKSSVYPQRRCQRSLDGKALRGQRSLDEGKREKAVGMRLRVRTADRHFADLQFER